MGDGQASHQEWVTPEPLTPLSGAVGELVTSSSKWTRPGGWSSLKMSYSNGPQLRG